VSDTDVIADALRDLAEQADPVTPAASPPVAGSGTCAMAVSRRLARRRSQLACSRYMIRRTYASGAIWIRPQFAAALISAFCSRSSAAYWSPVST